MVVYANSSDIIHIGRVGENKATTVAFDVTDWTNDYYDGVFGLVADKDGMISLKNSALTGTKVYTATAVATNNEGYYFLDADNPGCGYCFSKSDIKEGETLVLDTTAPDSFYSIRVTRANGMVINVPCDYKVIVGTDRDKNFTDDNKVYTLLNTTKEDKIINRRYLLWLITKEDTRNAGMGHLMLDYRINDILIKSEFYNYIVTNAIAEDEEDAPEIYNWVEDVLDKAAYINENMGVITEGRQQVEEQIKIVDDKVTDSSRYANEAWAWANGKNQSVAASELGYNNNAKYYSEEAAAKYGEVYGLLNSKYTVNGETFSSLFTALNHAIGLLSGIEIDGIEGFFLTEAKAEQIAREAIMIREITKDNYTSLGDLF